MVRRRPILKPVTPARRLALAVSAGGFGLVGVLVAGRGTALSSTSTRATTVDPASATSSSSGAADTATTFNDSPTTTTTWSARAPSTTSNAPAATPQGHTRVS
jgi:hypothetical protein